MAKKIRSPQALSSQEALNLTTGKVLLINPPVIDSRYPWIKWNQPLDLLKLGTRLNNEKDCQVYLYDFMLPGSKGTVPRGKSPIEVDPQSDEPTIYHFGKSWKAFNDYIEMLMNKKWTPDFVWITTLTSFWWQTIPLVSNHLKNTFHDTSIIVTGNYPFLETKHALEYCTNVDIITTDQLDITNWPPDYSLYENKKIRFCALDLFSPDPIGEIADALEREIFHFVFFNDDIFQEFESRLEPILKEIVNSEWKLWLHGICGVNIENFPLNHVQLLAAANFTELHFEPALHEDGSLIEARYQRVMKACEDAGFLKKRTGGWEQKRQYSVSGFLWVGRPHDNLEELVYNALNILQLTGAVIPKPYSPTPGTDDYSLLASQIGIIKPHNISPHRMPFAGKNGITKSEYRNLYQLTAFLNYRVRGQTFDFLGDSYLGKVISKSLEGRKWDI